MTLDNDPELAEVLSWWEAQKGYADRLRTSVRTVVDEIIDTPRTGRHSLEQLNPQEKAYIGTNSHRFESFTLPIALTRLAAGD